MGSVDRSLISGHLDRANLAGNGFKRLHGFEKGPHEFTVSVAAPMIGAGNTGHVDVTLVGSGLFVSKFHKCVGRVPVAQDPGLELLTTTIIAFETVRVSWRNT